MLWKVLKDENKRFYELMWYPIPIFEKWINFSWAKKNKFLEEYLRFIHKYGFLYRNLPFIKQIFLSNSITFNALNIDSDIDFFIICKKNRIWTCRTFAYFMFFLFGASWNFWKKQRKKIDLWFFVTEDNLNLFYISLKPFDRYLAYWLKHLVLLYDEDCDLTHKDRVFTENMWINAVFPDFDFKQSIVLGNKIFCGKGLFKKILEKILWWLLGDFVEKIIKYTWWLIILYKKKRMWPKWWWIIVSDKMLKFHWKDIRKKVNLLMKFKK